MAKFGTNAKVPVKITNPVMFRSLALIARARCKTTGLMKNIYYKIRPKDLGCEVEGVDLKSENRLEVIEQIKKDVTEYRILIFTGQGVVNAERQVEISKWFGDLESTSFYKHPKSPHSDIFRVSNDENEGCTGVGRTGWHIDGTFFPAPYAYSLYHMVSVPKIGATCFLPLTELIERLEPERREEWDQLWMISDRRSSLVHPLIYKHPQTRKPVMCFHLGMTDGFIWNYGTAQEREATKNEFKRILRDIYSEIVEKNSDLIYKHQWEPGQFIISDNLAVGHEAAPESQSNRDKVGLRILHRTTVSGTIPPSK